MKKLIFALSMTYLIAACQKSVTPSANDSAKANAALQMIPTSFSASNAAFGFNFWKNVNAQENAAKNYLVSPLSLNIALGMLANGANGKTKEEILQTLGFSGLSISDANAIYQNLITNLPNSDAKVANKIANSVWYSNTFSVEKPFLDNLTQNFKATVSAEDFSSAATVQKINNWASDHTDAKITKVLDVIQPDQVLFLLNALYFKGDWTNKFDTKDTQNADFMATSGTKIVKMMNATQSVKYAEMANYQALELPYSAGNYTMTLLLPHENTSLSTLINNFSSNEWQQLKNAMVEQKVMIGLPKFNLTYEINLNNILGKMGMPTAFSDAADLSPIAPPAGKLKVGFIKQNTYLGVDETGTTAAAVTTTGIQLTSMPNYPAFFCNRPFALLISEKQSNTILFIGKIVEP